MNEYKPNSHKYHQEQKERVKQDKIVNGIVKVKKKSGVTKLADVFISEDVGNVKSYIVMDVLIPAAKKAISDIVTNGIDMILYGETGRRDKKSSSISHVSYSSFSKDRHRDERPTRNGYSHDDIILDNRGEAEEVLTRMDELIETYGQVSVADMYDLVGQTCNYTDNKYGWTNLRNAEPIRVRDGYMLKLPKAAPLKD